MTHPPAPAPALRLEVVCRGPGPAVTAAGSVQGRRSRTGTSRAACIANPAHTGRSSTDFRQGSSSTVGAATPDLSPAGGQRPADTAATASQAAPEGAGAFKVSAVDSEAVLGTAARLEGAPVCGSDLLRTSCWFLISYGKA
jgi:hypothetical protein